MDGLICKSVWHHFPIPLIGREGELAWLKERLENPEARILTVTGPVGIGKSILAVAALERTRDYFHGGVMIADLDTICPELGGLNVEGGAEATTPPEEVREALVDILPSAVDTACPGEPKQERSLLVLEGCERILHQIREVLPPLLAARPGSTVLITAPRPVSAYGEEVLRLSPLPLPEVEHLARLRDVEGQEAVQLFVRRAKAARSDFKLTPENREAVVRLCQQTGGIPLAIELAAERMKLKTVRSVVRETEKSLDAYTGKKGGTLSRHKSMRDALAWATSFARPDDRVLLEKLSVFNTGVDLSTVTNVCGFSATETEERLARLVDVSLLKTEDVDNIILFQLEKLTRKYLRERLSAAGELHRARGTHADHFLAKIEALRETEAGGSPGQQLSEVHRWSADIRAAMEFFHATGDRESALPLAIALGRHGFNGTHQAALVLRENLASGGLPENLVPEAEVSMGRLSVMLGDNDEAHRLLRSAQARHEARGDRTSAAVGLRLLGTLMLGRGEMVKAEALLREADALLAASGAEYERLEALRDLTECLLAQGTHRAAKDTAVEALNVAERIGCDTSWALAEAVLSSVLLTDGTTAAEAEAGLQSAIRHLFHEDFVSALFPPLERLAALLLSSDAQDLESVSRGVVITSAASAHREHLAVKGFSTSDCPERKALARARDLLGPQRFRERWSVGQSLDLREAVGLAISPSPRSREQARIPEQLSHHTPLEGDQTLEPCPDNPLTRREMQVAELASRGETNQAIAKKLGISKWTAINHMRKIMSKLELSSRTEVAIWFEKARET